MPIEPNAQELTRAERRQQGKSLRKKAPRTSHGDWDYVAAGLAAAKVGLGLAKAVGWAAGAWPSLEKRWNRPLGF